MEYCGIGRFEGGPRGIAWCHVEPRARTWTSREGKCNHMDSCGVRLNHEGTRGVMWTHKKLDDITWDHMETRGVMWIHGRRRAHADSRECMWSPEEPHDTLWNLAEALRFAMDDAGSHGITLIHVGA